MVGIYIFFFLLCIVCILCILFICCIIYIVLTLGEKRL